ncbi:uncharacterized protein PITG_15410 [Phytophthora infestans T30-4]|uniref:Ankyrin repeat protein n=1 Tax=Phytophthora infestans (strain T30-4) TaxID=403677 RepID=D0NR68_PHYIT|nr:uncharacterized protein PITG_15410 [Phytophthora infestans T30-4]EEY63190.1 conserved hypothetical protein [Phytophthora infestans T30-4]|eukprot:XP_002898367.1 conserved hypothetical protein [Phytophthora infestans T30-4]
MQLPRTKHARLPQGPLEHLAKRTPFSLFPASEQVIRMTNLPTPPPLLSVKLVFTSKAVQHVQILDITTAFLDSAAEMELRRACKFGSNCLLDRIYEASLSEDESPPSSGGTWSRRHYLLTDRHYTRFQFRCAMAVAVTLKDGKTALEVVEWLLDQFDGCIILCERGRRDMVQAALNQQHEVIWWLHRKTRAPRAMTSVLMAAIRNGYIILLEWLRMKYRSRGFDPDPEDEDFEVGQDETMSGEHVDRLLRGDPEEFMQGAVYGGHLGVMGRLVENGYTRKESHFAIHPAAG